MLPILHIEAGSVGFPTACEWQQDLRARRLAGSVPDVLLSLEHPPVFSLGRRFSPAHLLQAPEALRRRGVEIHEVDRGGSITYHGPGQLVAYPVVDLRPPGGGQPDVIKYLRLLEAVCVATVGESGIEAGLRPGLTGVWVGNRKLAAIGVNISRGISRHGVALNVSTDLSYFSAMIPCGIPDAGVTSMERILGRPVDLKRVAEAFAGHLGRSLGRRVVGATLEELGLELPKNAALAGGVRA